MNVLVTGITGYVGSSLAPRLLRDGHTVRGFSRAPEPRGAAAPWGAAERGGGAAASAPAEPEIEIVTGDAVSGAGLERALADIDVAFYLIHSMEPSADGPLAARERQAASNFARAARSAGTGRIIYLGGLIPVGGPASVHLRSRLEVERTLLRASPCSVAIRGSIVIGAGSRSFRFLVRLVERLPVLAVPAWRTRKTSPVDERDLIEVLARTIEREEVCGRSLDIGGPDQVTYGELIDRIRDHLLINRPTIGLRRLTATPIASRIAAVIAGEHHELVGPLMESLDDDLLVSDQNATELLGVRLHSLDSAIEHALREWEATEPLAGR
jgi:uncharacterized protein YbjT (DUF2867 family)